MYVGHSSYLFNLRNVPVTKAKAMRNCHHTSQFKDWLIVSIGTVACN